MIFDFCGMLSGEISGYIYGIILKLPHQVFHLKKLKEDRGTLLFVFNFLMSRHR